MILDRKQQAGTLAAAVLAGDGACHMFWATGRAWPATTRAGLARGLLNVSGEMPTGALLFLSLLLLATAVLLLARAGLLRSLGDRLPARFLRSVAIVVTAAAAVRGIAGLIWILGVGDDLGSPFYWLNLALYTPACCLLLTAGIMLARSEPTTVPR